MYPTNCIALHYPTKSNVSKKKIRYQLGDKVNAGFDFEAHDLKLSLALLVQLMFLIVLWVFHELEHCNRESK